MTCVKLLADFLTCLPLRYMPKPRCQGSLRPAFFDSCRLKLKTWIYDLPPELRLDRLDVTSLPQAFTLHMVYSTACILLARPFLAPTTTKNATEPANNVDPKFTEGFSKADVLLQTSAKQICSTARKYRRVFGSFRRSPITATHCTLSAALVFLRNAKARSAVEATKVPSSSSGTDDLKICLDVLDELSTSWDTARRIRLNLLKLVKHSRKIDVDAGQDSSNFFGNEKLHGKEHLGKDAESLQGSGSRTTLEQPTYHYQPGENNPPGGEDQHDKSATDTMSASLGFGLEHTLETMIGDQFAFGADIMDDDFEWDAFLQQ